MGLAEKLERLARIVPGVAGYQDKEASRETDKTVRLRLADELGGVKRGLDEEKRRLAEKKELSLLPALERATSKLDKLGHLIEYAPRGYRGFFDVYKHDRKKLDQLCDFDLKLFDEIRSIQDQAAEIGRAAGDPAALKGALERFDSLLDNFEKLFSTRRDILTSP
jgi:hypothetical protein